VSNPYYNNSHNIGAGGFARGDQVDQEFQRVSEGFDALAAAVGGTFEIVNNADSPVAAVAGQGYLVDVSTGDVVITLPAAPAITDPPISIVHVDGTLVTDGDLTVARNGKVIMGLAEDLTVDVENSNFKLAFADNARGWRLIGI
jgi:hypothetical protein